MKIKLKAEIVRAFDFAGLAELTEALEAELDALSDLPLPADLRFRVTKLENLLCESPKTDLSEP